MVLSRSYWKRISLMILAPMTCVVADLERVFNGGGVVGLSRKTEPADAVVAFGVAVVLVAGGERVVFGDRPIQARGKVGALARVRNRLGQWNLIPRRV